MPKLHEILSIEDHKRKQFNVIQNDTDKNLSKSHLYEGQVRTLTALRESDKHIEGEEVTTLDSTVGEVLAYANDIFAKSLDLTLTKEVGNSLAKADLVVDGIVLVPEAPATFLLNLESRLTALRSVYLGIPTLAPGVSWVEDPSADKSGVYKSANPVKQIKTKKDVKYVTVAEATANHPAQVAKQDDQIDIGVYETTSYSGMMTPKEKAGVLSRLDDLIAATKAARQRANSVSVEQKKYCKNIFDFVFQ